MNSIYTIGFTKKEAKRFFSLLLENNIDILLDVRLNNTSQLAGFSKYPDIEYFLNTICGIQYISDTTFAPDEKFLKDYKSKKISWDEYVIFFNKLMEERDIRKYIDEHYYMCREKRICLLCSEDKPEHCHRSLVASIFSEKYGLRIENL